MCPSYKFVVRLIRPILERPKSVSLMWPIEVIRRLEIRNAKVQATISIFSGTVCIVFNYWKESLLLVRLEVTVHYAIVVQVLQCQDSLCKVHACHFNRESPNVLQQSGTVSTWQAEFIIWLVLMLTFDITKNFSSYFLLKNILIFCWANEQHAQQSMTSQQELVSQNT